MDLIKLAKKITKELKKLKEIKAIAVYGSVALGYNDKFSDLDMVAFCDKIPKKKDREKVLKGIVNFHKGYSESVDSFDIDDVKNCGIFYKEINDIKDLLKTFKEKKWGVRGFNHFCVVFKTNLRP